jgi:hypothetical protein
MALVDSIDSVLLGASNKVVDKWHEYTGMDKYPLAGTANVAAPIPLIVNTAYQLGEGNYVNGVVSAFLGLLQGYESKRQSRHLLNQKKLEDELTTSEGAIPVELSILQLYAKHSRLTNLTLLSTYLAASPGLFALSPYYETFFFIGSTSLSWWLNLASRYIGSANTHPPGKGKIARAMDAVKSRIPRLTPIPQPNA